MAYFQCPSCGETAMRVASRCPHCGLIFTPAMVPPAEPNRVRRRLVIAGALAALVVVAVVVVARNWTEPRSAPRRPVGTEMAPAESQPGPPVTVSTPSSRVQPLAPARDSAVDSPPPPAAAPPRAAPSPAAPAGELLQRYAGTWVNIRDRRSPNGASVRVLNPGEAILVDSLIGGWYRVVIDGQSIGYAYNSNLSEEAP